MNAKQIINLSSEVNKANYYKQYYRLRHALFNYAYQKQVLTFQAGPIIYRIKPMSDRIEFAHDIEPNEWFEVDKEWFEVDKEFLDMLDCMASDVEALLPSE